MSKRQAVAALLGLAILLAAGRAFAQTSRGAEHVVEAYDLRMAMETRWPGTGGYRPVRFEFTPTKPITADRQLQLVFQVYQWNLDQIGVVVKQVVDLPAGTAGVKLSLPVPFGSLRAFNLRVFEDGVELPKLAINSGATNNGNDSQPRILMLASDRTSLQFVDGHMQIPTGTPASGTSLLPGEEQSAPGAMSMATIQRVVQRIPLADFPSRWIEFTSLDVVAVTQADLKELATERRPQLKALMEWVRAGGNLWVTGVGPQWERLPEVEKHLAISVPAEGVDADDPLERGWNPPGSFSYTPNQQNYGGPYGVPMPMEALALAQLPNVASGPVAQEILDLLSRAEAEMRKGATLAEICLRLGVSEESLSRWGWEYGKGRVALLGRPIDFGQITVISQGSLFSNNPRVETLGASSERLLWEKRNGLLPGGQTDGFWKFLIPGVGLAPVGAFQILITLFVVIIGPLNYLLLVRYRRLQMLIVTTPLCALAITGGLFLYALITDGLGVRVRARSYTSLDQQAGQAASWTRLSYYAGLSPRSGMTFSIDTAVYPLRDVNAYNEAESRQPPTIEWVDLVSRASGLNPAQGPPMPTHQHLSQGWLSPRTPTEFLTQRSRPSKLRLEIMPSLDGTELTVTNRLGVAVEWLLIHPDDEKYYLVKDLAAGDTAQAQAIELGVAGVEYRTLFHAEDPVAPPEIDANHYRRMNWRRARRMWNSGGGPLTIPSFDSGRLERMLTETATPSKSQSARTYLAILQNSPELELGIEGATEEASFHVLSGKW